MSTPHIHESMTFGEIANQWDALLAENNGLAHELADEADKADALLAENQQLRDALQRLKGNVWEWEIPKAVRDQVDAALARVEKSE